MATTLRLQAELDRLYPTVAAAEHAAAQVRCMALELGRPASWDLLARAWQGVQADLRLPAPAICVTGRDAYQLWFSLSEPMPAQDAQRFLEALRARYLADVPAGRIALRTGPVDVPPAEAAPGHWSAFVAPDLAGLFAEEPWLDLPPGDEAQADLLSRIQPMKPQDLRSALESLQPVVKQDASPDARTAARPPGAGDARSFLLQVMNDPAVDLHLRIEAARALLPYEAS